jgi:hypothetical protein
MPVPFKAHPLLKSPCLTSRSESPKETPKHTEIRNGVVIRMLVRRQIAERHILLVRCTSHNSRDAH